MRLLAKWACTELLAQVQVCNRLPSSAQWLPLVVEGDRVGAVRSSDVEAVLRPVGKDGEPVFRLRASRLELSAFLEAAEVSTRTAAVAALAEDLRDRGIVTGWRDEQVAVASGFGEPPKFLVERAAYPFLGAKGYGVHVNGFSRIDDDDTIELWVARRSDTKETWPGLLDHIVAGHQPFGLSPTENVIKEAGEEAGIPEDLASKALAVGAVSYYGVDEELRLKNDALFCFDLDLPENFQPTAVDGEVQAFYRWPLPKVLDAILQGEFKPNVVIVIADFLIRRGFLSPDMPDYLPLVKALRQEEPNQPPLPSSS